MIHSRIIVFSSWFRLNELNGSASEPRLGYEIGKFSSIFFPCFSWLGDNWLSAFCIFLFIPYLNSVEVDPSTMDFLFLVLEMLFAMRIHVSGFALILLRNDATLADSNLSMKSHPCLVFQSWHFLSVLYVNKNEP